MCTNMESQSIMLSEISPRKTNKITNDGTHMQNLRNKSNQLRKNKRERQTKKQTLTYRKQTDGYLPRGEAGTGVDEIGEEHTYDDEH